MDRTLFVSDLDGTLLNSSGTISEKSANIISSLIDQGVLFTYATARGYSYAKEATKKINLNIPVATYNGVIIIDPVNNTVLDSCLIDKLTIMNIIENLSNASSYPIVCSLIEGKEVLSWIQAQDKNSLDFIRSRKPDATFKQVYSIKELFEGDVFYIVSVGNKENTQYMDNFFRNIDGLVLYTLEDTYEKGLYWFEIFNKKSSKGKSIEKLKTYAKAERIVCFGDSANDIPMFQTANYSVAVGNACLDLKRIANDIALTNNQDGVAEWLLHNIGKFSILKL